MHVESSSKETNAEGGTSGGGSYAGDGGSFSDFTGDFVYGSSDGFTDTTKLEIDNGTTLTNTHDTTGGGSWTRSQTTTLEASANTSGDITFPNGFAENDFAMDYSRTENFQDAGGWSNSPGGTINSWSSSYRFMSGERHTDASGEGFYQVLVGPINSGGEYALQGFEYSFGDQTDLTYWWDGTSAYSQYYESWGWSEFTWDGWGSSYWLDPDAASGSESDSWSFEAQHSGGGVNGLEAGENERDREKDKKIDNFLEDHPEYYEWNPLLLYFWLLFNGYDPDFASGVAGAVGEAQTLPWWGNEPGREFDPTQPFGPKGMCGFQIAQQQGRGTDDEQSESDIEDYGEDNGWFDGSGGASLHGPGPRVTQCPPVTGIGLYLLGGGEHQQPIGGAGGSDRPFGFILPGWKPMICGTPFLMGGNLPPPDESNNGGMLFLPPGSEPANGGRITHYADEGPNFPPVGTPGGSQSPPWTPYLGPPIFLGPGFTVVEGIGLLGPQLPENIKKALLDAILVKMDTEFSHLDTLESRIKAALDSLQIPFVRVDSLPITDRIDDAESQQPQASVAPPQQQAQPVAVPPQKPAQPPHQPEAGGNGVPISNPWWVGLIPVYGPISDAIVAFKKGQWFWGIVHTSLAVSDLTLVGYFAKTTLKVGIRGLVKWSGSHTWGAVKKWMLRRGWRDYSGQPFHHWLLEQNEKFGQAVKERFIKLSKEWGESAYSWISNQPWNILKIPKTVSWRGQTWSSREWHDLLHGDKIKGEKMTYFERWWYGSPLWFKLFGASTAGHAMEPAVP